MTDDHAGELPTPGRWYDDEEALDALDPAARPRRRVVPSKWNAPQPRPDSVRKRFRSRPSKGDAAPWGGPFYWCAFCNYVNTQAEGQEVRCPNHKREWERLKKQRQRDSARAIRRRDASAVALTLTYQDVRELQRLASASSVAVTRLATASTHRDVRRLTSLLSAVDPVLKADRELLALLGDWLEIASTRGE